MTTHAMPLLKPHSKTSAPIEAETQASNENLMTIAELAKRTGVTLRALRFYEQRGLLAPLRRGSARLYDRAQVTRLQMILRGKQLGFTLSEITELLNADSEQNEQPIELALDEALLLAQLRHLEERCADIDAAIEELRLAHRQMTAKRG